MKSKEMTRTLRIHFRDQLLQSGELSGVEVDLVGQLPAVRALEELVYYLETLLFSECLVTFHNRCVCCVLPCFAIIYLAVEARSGVSLLTFLLLTLSFFFNFSVVYRRPFVSPFVAA